MTLAKLVKETGMFIGLNHSISLARWVSNQVMTRGQDFSKQSRPKMEPSSDHPYSFCSWSYRRKMIVCPIRSGMRWVSESIDFGRTHARQVKHLFIMGLVHS